MVRKNDGLIKSVIIITVDRGPDENPRYEQVIAFVVQHFREHNLDGLFIIINASGRRAFNRVERSTALLSLKLSGIILPYDHYGSYLDERGRTVNEDLKKEQF